MPTQSQKNSLDIIKLQGEVKLINQVLEVGLRKCTFNRRHQFSIV